MAYLGSESDGDGGSDDNFDQISRDAGRTYSESSDDNFASEMPAKRLKQAPSPDKAEQTFTRLMDDDDGHSLKDDEKLALYLLQR